jgi:hypothetical protein
MLLSNWRLLLLEAESGDRREIHMIYISINVFEYRSEERKNYNPSRIPYSFSLSHFLREKPRSLLCSRIRKTENLCFNKLSMSILMTAFIMQSRFEASYRYGRFPIFLWCECNDKLNARTRITTVSLSLSLNRIQRIGVGRASNRL